MLQHTGFRASSPLLLSPLWFLIHQRLLVPLRRRLFLADLFSGRPRSRCYFKISTLDGASPRPDTYVVIAEIDFLHRLRLRDVAMIPSDFALLRPGYAIATAIVSL
jgi:hypothetical protein